jgi:hypothetical protein
MYNTCGLVVSIASYKERFSTLTKVIKSIFNQSIKPFKVVLNIENSDVEFLPDDIIDLINKNKVELIICTEKLKSHNKYYYVMNKYKNVPIVTIDDDCIYYPNLIETLHKYYMMYPKCVISMDTNLIDFSNIRNITDKYSYDSLTKIDIPTHCNIAIGWGGVLYPPNIFNGNLDINEIRKFISDDDLYLKILELRYNIKVIRAESENNQYQYPIRIPEYKHKSNLHDINYKESKFIEYFNSIPNDVISKLHELSKFTEIPKVIHTFWLSDGEIPEEFKNNFDTWIKFNPDYELIIHRGEEFTDLLSSVPYYKYCIESKNWCFATDYLRCKVLYEQGGIYFDGDVECFRNLDPLRKYNNIILGYEAIGNTIECASMMVNKGNYLMKLMSEYYENYIPTPGLKLELMPRVIHKVSKVNNYRINDILPSEYLSGILRNGWVDSSNYSYTIHRFTHSGYADSKVLTPKII